MVQRQEPPLAARTLWSVGVMARLQERIAKQLAEFHQRNTEPDYEEEARIILTIVYQERLAEMRKWRKQRTETNPGDG